MTSESLLWRRLDTPGHDACHFDSGELGAELDGTAVCQHTRLPARLDVSLSRLQTLAQRYERRSETTVWNEAPTVGYAALLELTLQGFIRSSPGVWELEA